MKRMVDFNAFAQWYSGTDNIADAIAYFDECLGDNIRPFVCTTVLLEVEEEPSCNGNYTCWVNGLLELESVDNYFECQ